MASYGSLTMCYMYRYKGTGVASLRLLQFSLLYNPFLNHQHPLPEMKALQKSCSTGVRRA